MSRYEKEMKDELDDEIKLAGIDLLVPEELENHLVLNSNRLRTFEDARLEVVTYVEAKFGLIIRDSKPSDTSSRGNSDPMDVAAVNSFSSGKGKGSSSPRDGCFKCGGAHFQRDCNARKSTGKQSYGKGKLSKSWSQSEPAHSGKGKSKENKGKSKGKSKGTKCANQGAKGVHKGKTSKAGLPGLETSKSETSSELQESSQTCHTDNSWIHDGWIGDEGNDGWSFDEWNDDWSSVGWHEGWEQRYDTCASSFSLGGLDVSATCCPKRFERVKMNLDTGAAVNTFPLNFGSEGAGDGRFYRTAGGEWIPDGGAWQFQGYVENGLRGSPNGRLSGVHKVLCSAAEIACKGREDFYFGHDGGYMIPICSNIGQEMRIHFEKLVIWYGKNELIPVYLENNIFNFYLNREVKSTETNNVNDADHYPTKNSQQSGNEDGRAVRS